jgi:hypothetical protein
MLIAIATPMYGGMCHGGYMHSVIPLSFTLAGMGDSLFYPVVSNESIITRGRDALVHDMLQNKEADGILFIDADTGFDPIAVADMVHSGKDFIGAIYPKKAINWEQVREAALNGEEDLEKYTGFFTGVVKPGQEIKITEPVKVERVGTGLVYISRKVFEELAPSCKTYKDVTQQNGKQVERELTQFFDMQFDENGHLLGEDYYFCERWKSIGGEIYAAPWVDTVHYGNYGFAGSFAQTIMKKD